VTFTDGSSAVAEDASFAVTVEDLFGDVDDLVLPDDKENVSAVVESESLPATDSVPDYDAAMLELDLLSTPKPDDNPDSQPD
jgi:hypothetical protein